MYSQHQRENQVNIATREKEEIAIEIEQPSVSVALDYEKQKVKIYWDYPSATDISTYKIEILGSNGEWYKERNECNGENELIAKAKSCELNVQTLLDEPYSLLYNDPILARVSIIEEDGWEQLNSVMVQFQDIVALQYPIPDYVTGKLIFGDGSAYIEHMWIDDKRTSQEVRAGVNPLTAFNVKTNEKDELVGIQLVYAETGKTPLF